MTLATQRAPSKNRQPAPIFASPALGVLAGVLGVIGVALAAVAAHVSDVRAISAAAHLALAHAPAVLVIAATRIGLSRLGVLGGAAIGLGTVVFVVAVIARPLFSVSFLAPIAPYGGGLVILGWLILASAGIIGFVQRTRA